MTGDSAHDLEGVKIPSGMKNSQILKTAPHDIRNPNTNQAKHCYYKYNEFFRCEKFRGEGAEGCKILKAHYHSLCPTEWVERWDEQREAGNFAGPM